MLKIGLIIGSTRDGRLSSQVADWLLTFTEENTEAEFEIIDIKDYEFEEFNSMPPGMMNREYDSENVTKWSQKIDSLDGFIFICIPTEDTHFKKCEGRSPMSKWVMNVGRR